MRTHIPTLRGLNTRAEYPGACCTSVMAIRQQTSRVRVFRLQHFKSKHNPVRLGWVMQPVLPDHQWWGVPVGPGLFHGIWRETRASANHVRCHEEAPSLQTDWLCPPGHRPAPISASGPARVRRPVSELVRTYGRPSSLASALAGRP